MKFEKSNTASSETERDRTCKKKKREKNVPK